MENNTSRADAGLALTDLRGAFTQLATATAYIRHADGGGELQDNRTSAAYSAIANAERDTLKAIRLMESFCTDVPLPA